MRKRLKKAIFLDGRAIIEIEHDGLSYRWNVYSDTLDPYGWRSAFRRGEEETSRAAYREASEAAERWNDNVIERGA